MQFYVFNNAWLNSPMKPSGLVVFMVRSYLAVVVTPGGSCMTPGYIPNIIGYDI